MKEHVHKLVLLVLALVLLQSSGASSRFLGVEAAVDAAPAINPALLLQQGLKQRNSGNHDQAAATFQQLLRSFPQADEAERARYALGESAYLRQDWAAAISLFNDYLGSSSDRTLEGRALLLLARSYESVGQHQQAVDTYARYESLGGPLVAYAAIRSAAQLEVLGRHAEAAAAYQHGGTANIASDQRATALEQAVRLHDNLGQAEQALANIDRILSFAQNRGYRNTLLLDGAKRALNLGKTDQAAGYLTEIVEQSAASQQSLEALRMLQSLGWAIDPLSAGKTLLHHEQYVEAIPQFDAASAGQRSSQELAEARRLRALAIRATGDYATAEAELRSLGDTPVARQALLDAIQTHGWAGDVEGAKAGYRAFAEQFSDDPLAPEALRRVVELTERGGDPAAIRQARLELGRRYPSSTQGRHALVAVGLATFQQGLYEESLEAWRLLAEGNVGTTRAQGLYWAGRLQNDLGDPAAAGDLLRRAYETAPDSYYGVRAAELLGSAESDGLELGAPLPNDYRQTGMLWIASWYSPTAPTKPDALPEVVRARELGEVFLETEAASEWTVARDRLRENPVALYHLALTAHDAGNDRTAMHFAEAILRLAPETSQTPTALRRLLYPTPWTELVLQESDNFNVDPFLVYALMRQESRFNPQATSWVGARGLMQVMPTTGQGIAGNLQVHDFMVDDLYNPVTSIRFGAYYIGAQVKSMNGSFHGGMAAYNGGLGNALRWAGGDVVADPDVFMLTIDYRETRHYVEVCYANYGAYKRLYKR